MRNVRLIIGIIAFVLVVQGAGFLFLSVIVYQSTPKSILARETILGVMPGLLSLVRVLDRSTNMLYWGKRPPEPLPQYSLIVDPMDMRKIEEALPKAPPSPFYGNLFLQDENKVWIKGVFRSGGQEYDVKVRVRGDLFNHWAYRKKSWRIEFPNDKLFRGMREITLLVPEDRAWFGELLNVERARQFGLPHPPTRFVTLSLNGSVPMLYIEFEHWTKEMLEKLGIGNANVYQTGGGSSYFEQWDSIERDSAYWGKYVSASSAPLDSKEEIDLLIKGNVRQLFDDDDLVKWYAHSLLAGSKHVIDHNLRLIFDRSRGRFVPVPWDVHLYSLGRLGQAPTNFIWKEAFEDPVLRLSVYRFLWDYVNDKSQVKADIERAEYLRSLMERAAYRDTVKLPSNRTVRDDLDRRMNQIRGNVETIKNQLELCEVIVDQRITDDGVMLDITVRGVSPAVFHGGGTVGDKLLWVDFIEEDTAPHTRHSIFVPGASLPMTPDIRNAVTGKKATVIGESVIDERTFDRLDDITIDRRTFLKRNPSFTADGATGVRLAGSHTFLRDTVIPMNTQLKIAAGTTVRMGSGVSLLSYSPVYVEGTEFVPVQFLPATGRPWGVFAVLRVDEPSSISWAQFSGGGQDSINGAFFTGMVAFHESPVNVRNSVFRNAHGDDALNIKYIPADLSHLTFEDNIADALDIDAASSGILEDSTFRVSRVVDSNGDGVDLSWSAIVIRNITVEGYGDKCVSVGEKSEPLIQDSVLKGCAMGIAAKDGSKTKAERIRFEENDIGVSAYIKKAEFEPPEIEVVGSIFVNNGQNVEERDGGRVTIVP